MKVKFRDLKWMLPAIFMALVFFMTSCSSQESTPPAKPQATVFNPEVLKIPEGGGRKLRGQVLYMPIYSNIPYYETKHYDLSAFLAVHNTDLVNRIKLTNIVYFDTEGRVVKNFLSSERVLNPLATAIFGIPPMDQSGAGANFVVEWISDQPVSEPLTETVMKDLSGNRGISFLSTGRVIREIR